MSKIQVVNLTIFFGLGSFLYGFIFIKYHYSFTFFYVLMGVFLIVATIFFSFIAWNFEYERE